MKNNMGKAVSRAAMRCGAALVVAGVLLLVVAAPAAAGSPGAMAPLVNNAMALIAIGIPILLVGLVIWYFISVKYGIIAIAIALILILLGFSGWMIGAFLTGGGDGCGDGYEWNGIECVPTGTGTYRAEWDCEFVTMAAGGPGGAHDAVTEFPDTPFVAADGGTPDLNKVIAVPVYDYTQDAARHNVAIAGTAATTNAAYVATDAFAADIRCRLLNPKPAAAGGNQEIPLSGKISVTRTVGTNNNGSVANVFYGDLTAGWYLGFGTIADSGATGDAHDADHTYVSYTNSMNYPGAAPLDGVWRSLGTSDGDPDGEWVDFWYVLDTGISDYTTPVLWSAINAQISLGTDPTQSEYQGNVVNLHYSWVISART